MLIESFLDYLQYERNYSEKTVLAYGEDIKQLQEFAQEEYGKFNPLEVEAELIREWIVSLMDKGYTSTSVNRKLSSLRTFYKYLLRQGETTIDPLRKVKGPKNKKPLPVFLKENEMNRLLDETDFGEGFKGCRDRLIIEMFYATGMRLSELIGLDNKDVDFSASLLKVTGKRNKQRLIPFGDELQELMLEYINVRNEAIPERSKAFFIKEDGEAIYCGWNIHHILPKNCGGTNAISNLTCTNIATNDEAADKITFWIDDCLYQVQRTCDGHGIFQLN